MTHRVQTDRLILRIPHPGDAAHVYDCMQDSDIPMNLARAPYPYQLSDAQNWIADIPARAAEGADHVFFLDYGPTRVVGCVGLTQQVPDIYDLGYWIAKPHWGKGFATEAAAAMLEWGQTVLGVTGFTAGYIADNPSSGRVLEKLGFQTVGVTQQYVAGRKCEVEAVRMVLNAPADTALRPHPHSA